MHASRRAGLFALGALAGCTSVDLDEVGPPENVPLRKVVAEAPGVAVHAVRTGWVGIKEPHWRYSPPGFLIVPRIFLSRRWHEWLPVISYVVVVPEGVVVVDSGADPAITSADYMACDPRSRFFYERNLRFRAAPAETIDRQLVDLGIAPDQVSALVITHFHADHSGRIGAFPRARVWTGRGNWPTHLGSVPCTLPPGLEPRFPDFGDGPFGAFGASEVLLRNDDVRIVPLPGHTPGHVGVLVRLGDRWALVAGDATFDRAETEARHVAGVSTDVGEARATQERIARQLAGFDTLLLPAHDRSVLEAARR